MQSWDSNNLILVLFSSFFSDRTLICMRNVVKDICHVADMFSSSTIFIFPMLHAVFSFCHVVLCIFGCCAVFNILSSIRSTKVFSSTTVYNIHCCTSCVLWMYILVHLRPKCHAYSNSPVTWGNSCMKTFHFCCQCIFNMSKSLLDPWWLIWVLKVEGTSGYK